MKPDYKILANNRDITQLIKDNFVSLSLNDNDGIKNDALTIKLNNENNHLKLPKKGVELTLHLGYENDLYPKGSFEIDEIKVSGHPDVLTIIAKGSRINKSLKIRRSHTYENTTIGELVDTIAKRNNMVSKVSEFLRDIEITHLNQVSESDQNLLTRLKQNYDAEFKSISSTIVFYQKDDFKKIGGTNLKPIVIKKSDCLKYNISQTDSSKYESVIAKFRDLDVAVVKKVQIGLGSPAFIIKEVFASVDEAKQKASTKYNDLLRSVVSAELTCIGNAKIAGEHEIILKDFHSDIQTNFKCVSSSHTIDNNGYQTSFKIVNKK